MDGIWQHTGKHFDICTGKGKGYGLIALEDIKKDDFIINYIGKIVYKDPKNEYGMNINSLSAMDGHDHPLKN